MSSIKITEIIKSIKSILSELNYELHNGDVIIYEYCMELKRLVQLKNETAILKLTDNSNNQDSHHIQHILDQNDTQIALIKAYETLTQSKYEQTNRKSETRKLKHFNTLFQFLMNHSDSANYYSNKAKLFSKLKQIKLNIIENKRELEMLTFNYNLMKYDSVNANIYYKKFICFNHLKTKQIENENKNEKNIVYDFHNDCIYMATQISCSKAKLFVYDLAKTKNKNEKFIFNCEKILKILKNLKFIAIHFYFKEPKILIVNKSLEIICTTSDLDNFDELIGADSKYLYFKYTDWPKEFCIKVYTWQELNKINVNTFQADNPDEPFYVTTHLDNLTLLNETYIYSYKCNGNLFKIEFRNAKKGLFICSYESENTFELNSDNYESIYILERSNSIVILNLDSNANLLSKYELVGFRFENYLDFLFFFHENNKFYFYFLYHQEKQYISF